MMFRSKPICLQHDLSVCSKHYSKITNVVLELRTQSTKGFFSFILNEVSFSPVLLTIHKLRFNGMNGIKTRQKSCLLPEIFHWLS